MNFAKFLRTLFWRTSATVCFCYKSRNNLFKFMDNISKLSIKTSGKCPSIPLEITRKSSISDIFRGSKWTMCSCHYCWLWTGICWQCSTGYKQQPEPVLYKSFFLTIAKFTEKHLFWSFSLIKLQAYSLQRHEKRDSGRLWPRCFLVGFANFLKTPIFEGH